MRRLGYLAIMLAVVFAATASAVASSTSTAVIGSPAACPTFAVRRVAVSSSTLLTVALRDARPGDVIELAEGVYRGHFVADRPGTSSAPITLCGSRRAIVDGGTITIGYAFALRANYWHLTGFTVRNARKGIMTDRASFNVLRALEVYNIGDEGVHFRTFSSDNRLEASFIHDVGLYTSHNGEGVYVGSAYTNWPKYTDGRPDRSDRNQIIGNTISATTAESVDLKEGTTGGRVSGNTFVGSGMTAADSWVDVKGNGYVISHNRGTSAPTDGFQTHVQLAGWGNGNTFQANIADVRADGYGFRIKSGSTGNVVTCDNVVLAALRGFANVTCP